MRARDSERLVCCLASRNCLWRLLVCLLRAVKVVGYQDAQAGGGHGMVFTVPGVARLTWHLWLSVFMTVVA